MARQKQYISNEDRYNYLLDLVVVNLYRYVPCERKPRRIEKILNKKDEAYQPFPELKGMTKLARAKDKHGRTIYKISYRFYFNCNRALRNHFNQKWEVKRDRSVMKEFKAPSWTRKTDRLEEREKNVLSVTMRKKLLESGYTIGKLRRLSYDLLFAELEKTKESLARILSRLTNITVPAHKVETYLSIAEIHHDIETPIDFQIAMDRNVRQRISELSTQENIDERPSFGHRKLPQLLSPGQRHDWDGREDKRPIFIKFQYPDKSTGIIYRKCTCRLGSINRAERRFYGPQISRIQGIGETKFSDLKSFKRKIDSLAAVAFRDHYCILATHSEFSIREKRKLFRSYLKTLCRNSWEEIWGHYKDHGKIFTGNNCGLSSAAIEAVRCLARQEMLFIKRGRGIYGIDWNWISQAKTRPDRENIAKNK